jgi:hypothetical protein
MNPERGQQLNVVLQSALEQDADAVPAYLDQAWRGDADMCAV